MLPQQDEAYIKQNIKNFKHCIVEHLPSKMRIPVNKESPYSKI